MFKKPRKYDILIWYCLILFVVTIPLSQYLSTRVLGLLLILSLPRIRPRIAFRRSWEILLFLMLVSLGLLYTDQGAFGLGVLETLLSLLLVPLAIGAIVSLDEKKLNTLLVAFVAAVCIGSLMCFISSSFKYFQTGSNEAFLYYELTRLLDFQPTYYAYFLVFSITCGLYLIYYGKSPIPAPILGIIIAFLFVVLLLTGGRTAFISMLLVCAFFVLKFLLERGRGLQRVTFGLVIVIIIGLFAVTYWVGDSTNFSDSWDRYDLWTSAIKANTDILWGVGTGDFKAVLNNYFLTHGLEHYASESLNSHNQFIQTYLSNGALGLIALLILIFRPLYLAFRQDNTLTILVLFPFLMYGMTEVFLGRYQGVVFFAMVHQIFISHLLSVGKPSYISETI